MKKYILIIAGALLLLPFFTILLLFSFYSADQIPVESGPSIRLYDRNGVQFRRVANSEGLQKIDLDFNELPEELISLLVASEDKAFYSHTGVDYAALSRSVFKSIASLSMHSGASTISMQLARILYKIPHSIPGKLQQIAAAHSLEFRLNKKEILHLFFNNAVFYPGTRGIEAASLKLFGYSVLQTSFQEKALLIGLLTSPYYNNPLEYYDNAIIRYEYVIKRCKSEFPDLHNIQSFNGNPGFTFKSEDKTYSAMHYGDYVLSLNSAVNTAAANSELHTYIDVNLNNLVEQKLYQHIQRFDDKGIAHGAVLIIDNKSGHVLSMVGSPDYWKGEAGRNNGTTALRQPGSTLKPLIYGYAFDKGYAPNTMLADIPVSYKDGRGGFYEPMNFDETFIGPVLLQEALGRSLNIPIVRLTNELGLEDVVDFLRQAGFDSIDKNADHYGLGVSIGSAEVSMLELAAAYSALSRGGRRLDLKFINDTDSDNDGALFDTANTNDTIMTSRSAFLITQILMNEGIRIRGFGENSPLILNFPVAVKTGTSENFRDSWTIGYNEDYTLAVWVGNFDGSPSNQLAGSIGAGPLFGDIFTYLVQKYDRKADGNTLDTDYDQRYMPVCIVSGMEPGLYCHDTVMAHVPVEDLPLKTCSMHKHDALVLPDEFADWYKKNDPEGYRQALTYKREIMSAIRITYPRDNSVFIIDPSVNLEYQTILLEIDYYDISSKLDFYINDSLYASSEYPFQAEFKLTAGTYVLEVFGDGKKSKKVTFSVE